MFNRQLGQQEVVRLEVPDELGLRGQNEQKGRSLGPDASCSANPMNIVCVGSRCVVLNDPINLKQQKIVICEFLTRAKFPSYEVQVYERLRSQKNLPKRSLVQDISFI